MTGLETLSIAVVGWAGAGASLMIAALGIAGKRWGWVLGGAAIGAPFALYLAAHPGGLGLGLGFLTVLIGAALAARLERRRLAWSLWALALATCVILMTRVTSEPPREISPKEVAANG